MWSDKDAYRVARALADPPAELLHRAVQAIGHSLIVTDLSGVILLWNPGAEDLYGWSTQEAVGIPITTLLVTPRAEADAAAILAPLAGGEPWSGEFPVRHKTGRVFSAQVSTWPLRDGTGKVIGFVGLSHEASPDTEDRKLIRDFAAVLRRLLPRQVVDPDQPYEHKRPFDPDATAVEIVTRGLDPELRAAADAYPHGIVLPVDGVTLTELDDLLASLVALAVHTATIAAERCGSSAGEVVASAALRLRSL